MADIKLNDLKPTGAELFLDSESFMNDLSNDEMNLLGGLRLGIQSSDSITCGSVTGNETSTQSRTCPRETDYPTKLAFRVFF